MDELAEAAVTLTAQEVLDIKNIYVREQIERLKYREVKS